MEFDTGAAQQPEAEWPQAQPPPQEPPRAEPEPAAVPDTEPEVASKGLRSFFRSLFGSGKSATALAAEEAAAEATPSEEEQRLAQQAKEEEERKQQEKMRLEAESRLPTKGSRLYELYCLRYGLPIDESPGLQFSLSVFTEDLQPPTREQRGWLNVIERQARGMLQYSSLPEQDPADAVVSVYITADGMAAYIFILPPAHAGEDATPEQIAEALKAAGVVYGIDEDIISFACADRRVLTLFRVATGTPPVDGTDGSLVDHYKRELEIQLTVKDDNTIDYKDLGWLQTIFVDEVICDVIPPTDATPGQDVRGREKPGKNGKKAQVPQGQGARLSEDGTALVAAIDGAVSFVSGRFRVDPLLIIKGDVETATGNLDAVGDVLIYGDVQEGFTVTATGNITVQGMIEGAVVKAGGNIQVGRGVNGNSHGTLEAKGDILSKFVENANITAGGKIICDNIINSTVSSDDTVSVRTGRGAIIGGSITALVMVDAITVGNQSNRGMQVTLGNTAGFLRELEALRQRRDQVRRELDIKNKNMRFLEGQKNPLSDADAKALDDLKLGISVQKMQLANLDRHLDLMERRQRDNSECRLRADTFYPPLQVTIGDVSKTFRQSMFNTIIYLKEGDIDAANLSGV